MLILTLHQDNNFKESKEINIKKVRLNTNMYNLTNNKNQNIFTLLLHNQSSQVHITGTGSNTDIVYSAYMQPAYLDRECIRSE